MTLGVKRSNVTFTSPYNAIIFPEYNQQDATFHNLGLVLIFVKNLWAPALWPEDMKGRVKVGDGGIVMKGMAENWVWAKFCC